MNYLYISLILFVLSILGIILNNNNIIIILMSLELMLLGINCNFLTSSVIFQDLYSHVFSLGILTLAAAESSIGLSILLAYYSITGSSSVSIANLLNA